MKYLCLKSNEYKLKDYSIVPYRKKDIFYIMKWRNEQIEILRQNKILTKEEQIAYYYNFIKPTFKEKTPKQILFSFLERKNCIGYGGLTNIDWINKKAELSFLLDTKRAKNENTYEKDFSAFLFLIKKICFEELKLNRLFAETYAFRKFHISILEKNGFIYEGRLRQNVYKNNLFIDSYIHSILKIDYDKEIQRQESIY